MNTREQLRQMVEIADIKPVMYQYRPTRGDAWKQVSVSVYKGLQEANRGQYQFRKLYSFEDES